MLTIATNILVLLMEKKASKRWQSSKCGVKKSGPILKWLNFKERWQITDLGIWVIMFMLHNESLRQLFFFRINATSPARERMRKHNAVFILHNDIFTGCTCWSVGSGRSSQINSSFIQIPLALFQQQHTCMRTWCRTNIPQRVCLCTYYDPFIWLINHIFLKNAWNVFIGIYLLQKICKMP